MFLLQVRSVSASEWPLICLWKSPVGMTGRKGLLDVCCWNIDLCLLRCFEEEYVGAEAPIGYIAYKINTCAPPGRRDLSAYSSNVTSGLVWSAD